MSNIIGVNFFSKLRLEEREEKLMTTMLQRANYRSELL